MKRLMLALKICLGFACIAVVTALGLAAYVFHQRHQYQNTPDTHDLKRRVEGMAAKYVGRRDAAALVIGVVQHGKQRLLGFGRTRVTNATPPDARTIFEIGSVTKVFTGITLASLAAKGVVKLDEPVARLLPRGAVLPQKDGPAITLRHLATHTSGLPRLPGNFDTVSTNDLNPYANYHASDLYRDLAVVKLTTTPGRKSEYSNYGFGLLGHLLELRTGKPYEALVKDTICQPLGMPDTTIQLSAEQRQRLTTGHDPKGEPVSNWDFDVLGPAGAFRSTAADLLKLVEANLDSTRAPLGQILDETQRVRFESWADKVGLAWQIDQTLEGPTFYWHNGGTGGYVSFIGFDREHHTGVVILSNYGDAMAGDDSVDDMGMNLLKLASKISWE